MTIEEYMELNKELVALLDEDLFKQRMDAERDELTVRQYEYIYALEARIAELEKQSRSEALIRCELEEEIDFFTRSMHFTPANTYEVLTGRIRELESMSVDEFALMKHQQEFGNG